MTRSKNLEIDQSLFNCPDFENIKSDFWKKQWCRKHHSFLEKFEIKQLVFPILNITGKKFCSGNSLNYCLHCFENFKPCLDK